MDARVRLIMHELRHGGNGNHGSGFWPARVLPLKNCDAAWLGRERVHG